MTLPKPYHVLFLCTHNSARSILAEALLKHLGAPDVRAYSAGTSPRTNQQPHPLALAVLQEAGIGTQGLYSKSWDVFAAADAPRMDLIVTVCDAAAGEACPLWPGAPARAHWGYPDPSAAGPDEAARRNAFAATLAAMRPRIEALLLGLRLAQGARP